jgi:hypothetical protein
MKKLLFILCASFLISCATNTTEEIEQTIEIEIGNSNNERTVMPTLPVGENKEFMYRVYLKRQESFVGPHTEESWNVISEKIPVGRIYANSGTISATISNGYTYRAYIVGGTFINESDSEPSTLICEGHTKTKGSTGNSSDDIIVQNGVATPNKVTIFVSKVSNTLGINGTVTFIGSNKDPTIKIGLDNNMVEIPKPYTINSDGNLVITHVDGNYSVEIDGIKQAQVVSIWPYSNTNYTY